MCASFVCSPYLLFYPSPCLSGSSPCGGSTRSTTMEAGPDRQVEDASVRIIKSILSMFIYLAPGDTACRSGSRKAIERSNAALLSLPRSYPLSRGKLEKHSRSGNCFCFLSVVKRQLGKEARACFECGMLWMLQWSKALNWPRKGVSSLVR